MITRRTPNCTQTPSCCTLATVMPQAPAASCCAKICGAIVVLPCGASSAPVAAVKSRIHTWLCSSADSLNTASGNGRSPRSRFQPCAPIADKGIGAAPGGKPLVRGSRISLRSVSRFSILACAGSQRFPQLGIEQVAKAVAHHLERDRGQYDRDAGKNHDPQCLMRELLAARDHRAPRWQIRRHADTEEGQAGFGQHGIREDERRLHEDWRCDVLQDMDEHD